GGAGPRSPWRREGHRARGDLQGRTGVRSRGARRERLEPARVGGGVAGTPARRPPRSGRRGRGAAGFRAGQNPCGTPAGATRARGARVAPRRLEEPGAENELRDLEEDVRVRLDTHEVAPRVVLAVGRDRDVGRGV